MVYSLIFGLWLGLHEFYVSVTNVVWEEDRLEFVTRIFYDDLQMALSGSGEQTWVYAGDLHRDSLLLAYLDANLAVECAGCILEFSAGALEGEGPTQTLVLKYGVFKLPGHGSVNISNTLLVDLYDEQINMMHLNHEGKKTSKNLDAYESGWSISR